MKNILSLLCCCFALYAFAQAPVKKLEAVKVTAAPKIDGVPDDAVWQSAPIATNFVEYQPVAGRHETAENRTEVKIIYDNDAIYVSARMYEANGKIARELTTRDNIANDDFFGVIFDTYQDGLNGVGFYVTAAGVQFDAKYSNGGNEDGTWNAVWDSAVKIDDHCWTAEFKIPYSALRFSKKDVQNWGLQMVRNRQFSLVKLFWNELDPKKNGFLNQEGQFTGLKDITPPLRLAFYPYFSTYVNHYPYNTAGVKNTTNSVNGGMDVKYGINQSFTLDLTLIPDFGQVQSDNQVLNLTPFEVKYTDNRPFFTEGTELFNKGNLFYTRRVGGQPIDYGKAYDDLKPTEQVISNPSETRLLNAIKISGRLQNGLGIGVFNAITQAESAVIEDKATGQRREVQTSPLANYNILVLDQNLPNNSAVTLINTNVDRFGKDYNADVGGVVFNLNNKPNSYNISGYGLTSNLLYTDHTLTGYSYEIGGGKTSGSFTWNVYEDLVDNKYNPNDLGILSYNNYFNHNINFNYADYKPGSVFTKWGITQNIFYARQYKPSAYENLNFNFSSFFQFKNLWAGNFIVSHNNTGVDFYEPRVAGRYYNTPTENDIGGDINSNNSKRLTVGVEYIFRRYGRFGATGHDAVIAYNYRISNKFSFGQQVTYTPRINNAGFSTIDTVTNNPVFARRNVQTLENIFNIKYTFNSVAGLSFRLRHYWSKLNVKEYFSLAQNGDLVAPLTNTFGRDNDQNYNVWNIDMLYDWQFSPGSVLSLAWKSSSLVNTDAARYGYFNNFDATLNQPKNNNYSVKVLYYIDYQSLRKKKKV